MDKLKEIIDRGFTESHIYSDIKDIRQGLSEFGVDLEENSKRQDKLIKQLKFQLRGSINKEKDTVLLKKATESFQEAIQKGLDKPIAYLNQLIQKNQVSFQFNKLDKLSEEEIEEIIKDQNLLEIIELLEDK